MPIRTFYDYVSARDENVIETWLNEIPVVAKAEIQVKLLLLRNVHHLTRPDVGFLRGGDCDGLIEIRVKAKNVQYRPLGYYGPGNAQVTLLIGAKEKGGQLEPRTACVTAQRRKGDISEGKASIREHRYS